MLKQIVLGILFMWAWVWLAYYSSQLVDMLGRNERAEKNLWWTRNAVVLCGFGLIVLWVLFTFGILHIASPVEITTTDAVNYD
jgi:hypothetical protein